MESRVFIKSAAALIERIKDGSNTIATPDDLRAQRDGIQKEVTGLFAGLHNPTLPTAYRLRDTALRAGYTVDQRVMNNLSRFDQFLN